MLFPGVLRDGGDAPVNLLCQLNGHVVLCASCLHRKWIKNVGAGQFGQYYYYYYYYYYY